MTNPQPAPPEPTDAQRIAARGRPITLADGREVRVRYGLRALAQLEERFGSLAAIAEALQGAVARPGEGRVIAHIYALLEAGLNHERIAADELDELLDPAQLQSYSAAVAAAFAEAMPAAAPGKAEAPAPAPLAPATWADLTAAVASTGSASTTSAPSPSDAPTSSGGT